MSTAESEPTDESEAVEEATSLDPEVDAEVDRTTGVGV